MGVMTRSAGDHSGSCGAVVPRSTVVLTVMFRIGIATAFVLAPAVEIEDNCHQLPTQPWS